MLSEAVVAADVYYRYFVLSKIMLKHIYPYTIFSISCQEGLNGNITISVGLQLMCYKRSNKR